ncbi:hypothetical protein [Luteolibacter soli]|uniref:PepSY domain-containing protein n=1 Tax=Luteolibacter soli TaxID=3135280 RepID=A0ABU9AYG4_9BACT
MMPCPFYRSRLFWYGVPGLVFLLWVWWDSGGWNSHVRWERPGKVRYVGVRMGGVQWGSSTLRENYPPGPSDFPVVRGELPAEDGSAPAGKRGRRFDFPPLIKTVVEERSRGGMVMDLVTGEIALWGIVGCHVMVWVGMVFWWQRRKGRVTARLTDSTAGMEVAG